MSHGELSLWALGCRKRVNMYSMLYLLFLLPAVEPRQIALSPSNTAAVLSRRVETPHHLIYRRLVARVCLRQEKSTPFVCRVCCVVGLEPRVQRVASHAVKDDERATPTTPSCPSSSPHHASGRS